MGAGHLTGTAAEYAELAHTYDTRWHAYIRESVRKTIDRTKTAPNDAVLDLGTGTGALLQALLDRDPTLRATGVDPSAEMLEQASARLGGRAELIVAPAERLPFDNATFDVIVSSSSLHFWDDRKAGLAEAHRVLKPGGRLVITDWCGDDFIMKVRHRYLNLIGSQPPALTAAQFHNELTTAGFDILGIDRYRISWNWALMTSQASKTTTQNSTPEDRP